jgi:outer membrane protein assembly factor BamB
VTRTVIALSLLAAPAVTLLATDWPQFKGSNASGVSDEKGLPVEWGKDKGLKWKAALPARGVSSPVIAGGKVYVTCSSGTKDDRLHVLCFDAATGKKLWHRQLAATGGTACHPKTCMAAPTPVADEGGVYALFATGDVAAFDADGTLRWYRSLAGDYPAITNQVGMAASPVLVGDKLIVPMDNAGDAFLAAVDTKYGKNVWKAERPKNINWVTPVVRTVGGKTEVLFAGPSGLTAYDAASGARRWEAKELKGDIPTWTIQGDTLFVPKGGLTAVKLTDRGTGGELWTAKTVTTGMASPLVYDGRVYTAAGERIKCADVTTGKPLYNEVVRKGPFSASPVGGDGKVYCLNETGTTYVVKAGPEFELLATNELGEETLATPAIAGGCLFIRTDKALYCVGK